jgi:HAE1 family hydrophobic/amphiphilic exporter-1
MLYSAAGKPVSMSSVSTIRAVETSSQVYRKNRLATVTVTAYTENRDYSRLRERITTALDGLVLPPTLKWDIIGASALLSESLQKLLVALGAALFLVYAVMVIQFQRFAQPLVIMASVPFCLVGVVLGLMAFGSQLSMIAFLAIIALGGIVVNNAIVMVDYINRLRKEGARTLRDAIVEGAGARLRPILMTTLTTMFGVLPMAFSRGSGAELYAPLGQAIFGGLVTSTAITLFIVPVLYYLLERRRKPNAKAPIEAAVSGYRC